VGSEFFTSRNDRIRCDIQIDAQLTSTEPLPAMSTSEEATRYGARIIDNLCLDITRKNLRRRETPLKVVMTGAGNEPAPTVKSTEGADTRILLEDQPIAVDGALRLRVLR
jgi:DNA-directed RNA polymerase specialized sigma24 family protein